MTSLKYVKTSHTRKNPKILDPGIELEIFHGVENY